MNIVVAKPPIYAEAVAKWPMAAGAIFCWGDTLYNPTNGVISE